VAAPVGSTSASASASQGAATLPAQSASVTPTLPISDSDVTRIMQAGEHAQAAGRRFAWHDGAGCLAELDEHDRLDPRPAQVSTNADSSYLAMLRGECMMLSGQCEAGRQLYKKSFTAMQGKNGSPEQTDRVTDAIVGMYCHGTNLSPRDQVLTARAELQAGAWQTAKTSAVCMAAYKTVMKYRTTVVPRDDDDVMVKDPLSFLFAAAPNCLARAGDCDGAWKVFQEVAAEKFAGKPLLTKPDVMRKTFESITPKCKAATPTP
jgi:hypothetical protein